MSALRERLTFANVMASIAVFIALGAGAYAAGLPKNSVKTKQIKDGAVELADLAPNSVDSSKVADASLLRGDFASGQLPAGPQGPQGLAGDDGDDGTDGAPGPPLFVNVLQGGNFTGTPPNDGRGCTVAAEWRECGPVTVSVPANKTYKLAIDGTGSFFAFAGTNRVQLCASVRPSTSAFETTAPSASQPVSCNNSATGIDLDNELSSASVNGLRTVTGGATGTDYVVSTAVRPDNALHFYNGFDKTLLHTLVTVSEVP